MEIKNLYAEGITPACDAIKELLNEIDGLRDEIDCLQIKELQIKEAITDVAEKLLDEHNNLRILKKKIDYHTLRDDDSYP